MTKGETFEGRATHLAEPLSMRGAYAVHCGVLAVYGLSMRDPRTRLIEDGSPYRKPWENGEVAD